MQTVKKCMEQLIRPVYTQTKDMTRHHATQPVLFSLTIQSNGVVHTLQHDEIWPTRKKAASKKYARKKTATENYFHCPLSFFCKSMNQDEPFKSQ